MRHVLRSLAMLVMLVVVQGAPAWAADGIDWRSTPPLSGVVDGDSVVVSGPGTHALASIVDPEIEGDDYRVVGRVEYTGVEGAGYLEMWSYFADGGAYFSRTLAETGPLAALSGTSAARPFQLPFFLAGAAPPIRVDINVVLPGDGTVSVGPLELEGFGGTGAWWTERQAAFLGAATGIVAGLFGMLAGMLRRRRPSRRTDEAVLVCGLTVGVVAIVAASTALVTAQPRHVWLPLLLIGGILTVVNGSLIPALRRSHAASELQRIRALDA